MHTDSNAGWKPVPHRDPAQSPQSGGSGNRPHPHSADSAPQTGRPPTPAPVATAAQTQASKPAQAASTANRSNPPAKNGGFLSWLGNLFGGAQSKIDPIQIGPDRQVLTPEEWKMVYATIDGPVRHHRIAVSSEKGGVGKTTTVLGLGTAFATYRRDPPTALDANPHRGTLSDRLGAEHGRTMRDLLEHVGEIRTVADYRQFTSVATSRLEVIASEKDQARQAAFSPEDYLTALEVVQAFRQILITDTGTDMLLPSMAAVYRNVDTLVVPATTAKDGFTLALETLEWWKTHSPHGPELVANAVVPITRMETFTVEDPSIGPEQLAQDMREFEQAHRRYEAKLIDQLHEHVRAVVPIPNDPSLRHGGLFHWESLRQETREAYIRLAFEVAQGFGHERTN